jgi:hypothetical protein
MIDSHVSKSRDSGVVLDSIATCAPYLTLASLVLTGLITVAPMTRLLGLMFPDPAIMAYVGIALVGFVVSTGGGLSYAGSCALMFYTLGGSDAQEGDEGLATFLMNGGLIACLGGFVVGVATSTAFILVNIR